MKKQISEEINSMKFLLNYKRGIVISEQATTPGGIPQKAVDKIMAISAENKKGLRGSYLFKPQVQEIDSEFGTGTYSNFFKNGGEDVLKGEKSFLKQTQINTTADWSKYPCVPKHPQAKKGKTAKGSEYYQINDYYYYDNGRKYQISTKKIINYTCNDPEFKVNNTVNQKTPIPSELKNIEGVKLFQDWLDVNAQGWATGFANGILNKSAGYGNFGRRTKKAWTLYGKEYLQSLNTPVENEKESPFMKSQLEKIKSEKPNPAFTAPIQKVGTPLQSAQNPAPTVNQGLGQLKRQ